MLEHPGTVFELTAEDLSPTCHRPGVHGDLYACERCGTVQQDGVPTGSALVALYRRMRDDAYLEEEAGRRVTARRLLDLIESRCERGEMLDVGCAHGLLLDEARSRGWETIGLEPADAARAHAAGTLGLDVRDATLDDLDPDGADGGRFQAIVLADVLEHFDDPRRELRRCTRLLAPGGVLTVVTPDPGSRTARLVGGRWWGYLPAHTYLLPRATLRAELARAGLDPVVDVGLRRTFTLRYWAGGLLERGGALRPLSRLVDRIPAMDRHVTLSLGDERVVLARRSNATGRTVTAPRSEPIAEAAPAS